jgi:protein-S-isoprenylcysteine O-methyltransferase Ste14
MLAALSPDRLVLILFLVACLASFGWGMRAFFVQPCGFTGGMKLIARVSVAFAVLHLAAILLARGVPVVLDIIAALMYSIALLLYWWAIAANRNTPLSAAFSPDSPQHLMQEGPYRFVRHPFYCSYLLMWCAGIFASAQWWLALTTAVMLGIYFRAAAVEERKFSNSSLADAYSAYRRRTGMLAPSPVKFLTKNRSE